jgi:hypothetical protein
MGLVLFRWVFTNYSPANNMSFSAPLSINGSIVPRFQGYANEIFEANSRHVKLSVFDSDNERFEVRQFRRDTSSNFTLARLDPEDARAVIDLAVKLVSTSLENDRLTWVVRVSNNAEVAAKNVRVSSNQWKMTYVCVPGSGAECRDGDGNRILSAEVDLPGNGGYVEFKLQKDQCCFGQPLVAIPGFDQLEKSPSDNWIQLEEYFFFESFE